MGIIEQYLKDYLNNIQPLLKGELGIIQKGAYEEGLPIIPNDVVKLICFILSVKKPKKILEIGTAVGFSSCLMSNFLDKDGYITTIDRYDYMIERAKLNIEKMGLKDKINLLEGDANTILPKLKEKYDIIFMDAAKGQYIQILPECYRLLNIGGILIADDVLQNGNIAKDRYSVKRRQRTIHKRLREFLYEISNNPALVTSILTIGDGVAVCHKIKETEGLITKNE